jgi:hypothetical protein
MSVLSIARRCLDRKGGRMRRPSDASIRAHQATSAIRQRLRLVVATEALSAARIPIASGSRRWIGRRRSSSGVDAHRGGAWSRAERCLRRVGDRSNDGSRRRNNLRANRRGCLLGADSCRTSTRPSSGAQPVAMSWHGWPRSCAGGATRVHS